MSDLNKICFSLAAVIYDVADTLGVTAFYCVWLCYFTFSKDPYEAKGKPNAIIMHPDFRMVVLANRPGFPFLGNDFYGSLGTHKHTLS